jgi:hypothetical protein
MKVSPVGYHRPERSLNLPYGRHHLERMSQLASLRKLLLFRTVRSFKAGFPKPHVSPWIVTMWLARRFGMWAERHDWLWCIRLRSFYYALCYCQLYLFVLFLTRLRHHWLHRGRISELVRSLYFFSTVLWPRVCRSNGKYGSYEPRVCRSNEKYGYCEPRVCRSSEKYGSLRGFVIIGYTVAVTQNWFVYFISFALYFGFANDTQ